MELIMRVNDDGTVTAMRELVRCEDCKHRIPNPHGYTCKRLIKEVNLDHYCAWGERKDNATND